MIPYRVRVDAGEILHLRIEQQGLDVELLWPAAARSLDLPYGKHVPEELWWHSEVAADLRFEVRTVKGRGSYLLRVVKLGPATELDSRRAELFWQSPPAETAGSRETLETYLEDLAEAWDRADDPLQAALAWAELGRKWRASGRPEAALEALEKALKDLETTDVPALAARLHLERGQILREEGDHEGAAPELLAAAAGGRAAGDLHGMGLAINELAVSRDIQGELAAACESYGRARRLFAQVDPREATKAQLYQGRCYAKLGSLPEAPALLRETLHNLGESEAARPIRAEILREIGWWQRLEGRPREALDTLREALALDPETPGLLDRLGTVHADLGEIDVAHRYYEQAFERAAGAKQSQAHVRLNLCRLEARGGRPEIARALCQEALGDFRRFDDSAEIQALLLLAELNRSEDLEGAEGLASQALAAVEERRGRMGPPDRRSAYLAERLDAHHLTIELRMELDTRQPGRGWAARALEVSELTRTRNLLDLLQRKEVRTVPADEPDRSAEERTLQRRIAELSRSLAGVDPDGSWPLFRDRLAELALLEERLATFRLERAKGASLPTLDGRGPFDVAAIQELLDRKTLLLVYHLGTERSFLWAVQRQGLEGFDLGETARIERLAESWYQLLSRLETQDLTFELRVEWGRLLSEALLAPVSPELERSRRLVIVGDGPLLRIPFGALPRPDGGMEPLLSGHEIVHLPSAGVLVTLRGQLARRAPAEGLLAVVADPVFGPEQAGSERGAKRPPRPRLVASAEEARTLLELAAPAATLLLERHAARLDRILSGELAGYRILHFATHAETQGRPGRPLGLILSLLDSAGQEIEGILGLQQLYNLELPAELAVLSACGTALGEEIRGEGLVGLTRGFMHAGTPRVVVSLWDVQDRAASELMGRFYRYLLRSSKPPAEALRCAQVDLWREGWPASAWAPWVFQGDWEPFPHGP